MANHHESILVNESKNLQEDTMATIVEILLPLVEREVQDGRHENDQTLVTTIWPAFNRLTQESLAAGSTKDQIADWVRTRLTAILAKSGAAGAEALALLRDKSTLDNAERVASIVAILMGYIPQLQSWHVSDVILLAMLSIRILSAS